VLLAALDQGWTVLRSLRSQPEGRRLVVIGGWRGPGRQLFDADPRFGGAVRDWIRAAISEHSCPVDAADAALVVTELFSNACKHGPAGGRVLVGYCLWRDGARLVVCDGGGPGAPRLADDAGLAEGGRGLRVVDALAARWDTFKLADGSRVVWCDLGQPLRAPAADAWAWLPPVLAACPLAPQAALTATAPRAGSNG
jgi:anti-sigma regulatory factor (Ser/Thr protein kinase)